MGDPHFRSAGCGDGVDQLGPVGMVGDDERQLDAALAGARPDPHPAGGEGGQGIAQAPRPAAGKLGGRAHDESARQCLPGQAGDRGERAERDALALIEGAELLEGAMEIDRGIEAGLPQGDDHALALAEPVDAEKMRAVGIGGDRGDEPAGLAGGALVAEHRKAEGRLGDEEIAAPQREGRSRRVGRPLVVAGDDGAGSPETELDLGGAENVTGGMEAEGDAADQALLAIGEGLEGSAGCLAKADAHDAERLRRRQDGGHCSAGHGRHGHG